MTQTTVHNPDRYMADLRQILSQGRKRIGLFIGAGAPVALRVNAQGKLDSSGDPIIPDVARLTTYVIESLETPDKSIVNTLLPELGPSPNIETILTRVRRLAQAIGLSEIHGLNAAGYEGLAERICNLIGARVNPSLPVESNPYTELVSWIGGTHREHPVEIFSPNYDLLTEEAFERAELPYFDGFSGSHKPFFDPTSMSNDTLPTRWSRLWKIHGSLGWDVINGKVIRTGSRDATKLIYPDHLKYDQITRQPYSAMFERLKEFLSTPDSILLCTGFSFFDSHITALLDEALEANKHTAIFAFQFKSLEEEKNAVELAKRRPNMSVYANDGAVIHGVGGKWLPGQNPNDDWLNIRKTFWDQSSIQKFILGDFAKLARFFALSKSTDFTPSIQSDNQALVDSAAGPEASIGEINAQQ
ncbi:SIR2 family protein [Amphritea sp.]|uniref:SIR2 family protein n=1 Tax=Amphritea sp. TaxID=1872502 RepID=UPI003D111DE6